MTQSIPTIDDLPYKNYDPIITRRLLVFALPYRYQFLLALLLMLINSGAAVLGPYLVKIAIDSGIEANSISTLKNTVIIYLLLAVIQWISIYWRVNLMAKVGQSIIYDLRSSLFQHLQDLSLGFFSHFSVGRVITRVINDVGVLREFLTWAVLAIARDIFTLVGILIAMIIMNWLLALIVIAILPIMILITVFFRRIARQNYRLVRTAISWVNSVLAENINAVRVVQAFSRQEINYNFFHDQVNKNNLDVNLKTAQIASAFPSVIDFLGSVSIVLVVWFGGKLVLTANPTLNVVVTPGILVAFLLYVNRFFDPIRDLSRRFDTFQSTMAGGERIIGLLDTPIDVQDIPDAVNLGQIKGDVIFDHVSFYYKDESHPEEKPLILKDLNLHVMPGEAIALVGETGAGKTTFVRLIGRFYDPSNGRVLIDGYDLRNVTQKSLRSQLGIVLQDPYLFNDSVKENIRFGRLEASDEDVEATAKAVGADGFIRRMRDGYDTSVQEGGVTLSVGQRQLVSFARALLADPRILILDEATSSVDTQTEIIIQQALAYLLKGRTSFVIAHRLSTVINADRIIVIRAGEIVEQGTHQELLSLDGYYAELYRSGFEQ